MSPLSKIILLFFCVHLAATAPPPSTDLVASCGFWTTTKFMFKCRSLIYDAASFELTGNTQEDFKNKNEMCDDASKCINSFECKEIKEMKNEFSTQCENIGYTYPDNGLCLRGFLRKAYMAQFSNETSCFKEHSFFDNDFNKRKTAFKEGKLCFVKYSREHCTTQTIEYFNADKYQQFAESISTDPFDPECNSPPSLAHSLQCRAMSDEFEFRVKQLSKPEFESNLDYIVPSRKICRDTQACVKKNCVLMQVDGYYRTLVKNCEILERSYPR